MKIQKKHVRKKAEFFVFLQKSIKIENILQNGYRINRK